MTAFKVDRRDVEFLLFEQFKIQDLGATYNRYADMNKEVYEEVLAQGIAFCANEMAPRRAEADELGCTLKDNQVYVPEWYGDIYKKYGADGWIAPGQNPEYGGMGMPMCIALVLQGLGIMADASFMFYPGLTVAAAHLIENFGADELKNLLVPKMYGGEWTGTMCLTEPHAGTAVGDIRTVAEPIEGTNEFKIKGEKIFISAGDHQLTENIIHLVLARIPGDPAGTKGISLFAVPKYRYDASGAITGPNDVKTTGIEHKMGINASSTCALSFGENDDCHGVLVGDRCKGIVAMFQMMNEARIACGMQGAAMASASYLFALDYAKEREQGAKVTDRSPDAPKVKIIEHPDVRRNLMISKAYSEGLWALLIQSSVYAEHAHYSEDEETKQKYNDLVDLLTPICKAYATDQGFKVTELAIQVHGGYGYVKEYGVEQYMRDVKIASIYEGTNGVQALDLLGRKMRQKGGQLFMTWVQESSMFLAQHTEHPRLGNLAQAIDKSKNMLGEVAFNFTAQGQEDAEFALLGATPFLEMFGHVEVARLLLDQALLADQKLEAIYADKGADTAEAKRELCVNNEEVRFYDSKIKTAQFFVSSILPKVGSLRKEIMDNDRSALDIIF
jgi:alkylation response protein AidB-like acyl-CoA dehydrogenase